MKPDSETREHAATIGEPAGADVLRELDAPSEPHDPVAELRSARAVLHAHYKSNCDVTGELVERIVRAVVFGGCAPVLLLAFMFILGVLWAWGSKP